MRKYRTIWNYFMPIFSKKYNLLYFVVGNGQSGHRHLQIGRMLDIDLISEPPHALSPQMYVFKVWESVWPEGQEAIHS